MRIQFIGATETVTGSKYLLHLERHKILVDCGLFQGLKNARKKNWQAFPIEASQIDAVILTHAHIDHSGYLPALMKQGFKGPIYCSHATRALCKVLLPDAGYLQEEDARYANKAKFSRHQPAEPLYTEQDAIKVLKQFKVLPIDQTTKILDGCQVRLRPVGHILGASSVRIDYRSKEAGSSITFSGDVGRPDDLIMYPPESIKNTDYLIVESTYGDRLHPQLNAYIEMRDIIKRTIKRGGIVLLPAFAVGRAQLALHIIEQLRANKEIPKVPVFLNSPMAITATELFFDYQEKHRLSRSQCEAIDHMVTFAKTKAESIELVGRKDPCIIISASGMASGGRVLHHLKALLPNPKNSILFLGYQAAGTRGYSLTHGHDRIKIHGGYVPVNAEVHNLEALSSHGDYQQIINWLKSIAEPKKTFITHGEASAADCMRCHIKEQLNWQNVIVPEYLDSFTL
jgi:metallo-beta-lactamase family protein